MKRWIALMMAGGVALSASAEMLEQWTFDEPLDTTIENCANSGTVGTIFWAQDFERYSTDGEGNLLIKPNGGGYAQTSAFPTGPLSGAGTYSMEMKIAEWDIAPGETKSTQLNYRLGVKNSAEINIRAILDIVDGLKFTFIVDSGGYRTFTVGGLSGSNVTARIDFSVAEGWANCYIDDVLQTDFSGKTLDIDAFLLQKQTVPLDPNTVFKLDELNLSFAADDPVVGAYIVSTGSANDSIAAATNTVKTFNALAGDYVVVMAASDNDTEPVESSIAMTNGTATIGSVVYASAGTARKAHYWYSKVTADGTIDVDRLHNGSTYWGATAYLVRSTTGLVGLLDTAADTQVDVTEGMNIYSFGEINSGLYIEAAATFSTNGATATDPEIAYDVSSGDHRRRTANGAFSDVTSLTNTWTLGMTDQIGLLGLAFTGLDTTAPQSKYDNWLSGYSVGTETGMLDDADGDLLDNLTEYAFGGDPSDSADQGNTPVNGQVSEGGTNYLMYVHYELDDAADRGLSYTPEAGTDLVITDWAGGNVEWVGSGASAMSGFDVVTNRIPTDVEAKQFIRLQVEFTP